jgi:hypothetical protein
MKFNKKSYKGDKTKGTSNGTSSKKSIFEPKSKKEYNNNSTIYRLTEDYSKTSPVRPIVPKGLYPRPDLLTLWTSNRIRAFKKQGIQYPPFRKHTGMHSMTMRYRKPTETLASQDTYG